MSQDLPLSIHGDAQFAALPAAYDRGGRAGLKLSVSLVARTGCDGRTGHKPTGESHMTTQTTNRPSHGVFMVEGEGKEAFWTKIGAAWAHKDGEGFSLQLTAMPLNGRLSLRTLKAKDDNASEEGR